MAKMVFLAVSKKIDVCSQNCLEKNSERFEEIYSRTLRRT